ncbi:hypothetical protein CEXT_123861 [Caerostris extrusa]|uniref:Uncharacterized protein n=1 Tax=Caerostris extrusa TaxID=172846 RepID=A0AAV4RFZ2_CAEEX|nr:hypothetical protein CEXT_123861 [Caerostris extrusa]
MHEPKPVEPGPKSQTLCKIPNSNGSLSRTFRPIFRLQNLLSLPSLIANLPRDFFFLSLLPSSVLWQSFDFRVALKGSSRYDKLILICPGPPNDYRLKRKLLRTWFRLIRGPRRMQPACLPANKRRLYTIRSILIKFTR